MVVLQSSMNAASSSSASSSGATSMGGVAAGSLCGRASENPSPLAERRLGSRGPWPAREVGASTLAPRVSPCRTLGLEGFCCRWPRPGYAPLSGFQLQHRSVSLIQKPNITVCIRCGHRLVLRGLVQSANRWKCNRAMSLRLQVVGSAFAPENEMVWTHCKRSGWRRNPWRAHGLRLWSSSAAQHPFIDQRCKSPKFACAAMKLAPPQHFSAVCMPGCPHQKGIAQDLTIRFCNAAHKAQAASARP